MDPISIDGRSIGPESAPFVVAEAGNNFRGDIELAKRFVEEAADAGADAIKFQSIETSTAFSRPGMAALEMGDLYDRLGDVELSREDHQELQAHCERSGIEFLSTPFSVESVDLLDSMDVGAIKIGSGELTDHHILRHAVATGRPLIVSTGMADLETIDRTHSLLDDLADSFALLYCVSLYPTEPGNLALDVIETMRDRYDVPVGFSDHSLGIEASVVAMSKGASIIEKHFTIDRRLPGGDQAVSIEPEELERLVEYARLVEETRGSDKPVLPGEAEVATWAHHSVVTREPVAAGEEFTERNLTTKRPGTGVPAADYYDVIGRVASRDLDADIVVEEGDIG